MDLPHIVTYLYVYIYIYIYLKDKEYSYKPFGTFRTNMDLNAWKASVGVNYLGDKCKAMSRLSTDD